MKILAVEGRQSEGGSLASRTYVALLDRIRRGELKPGTRLREEDVAKLLGVSRTPVREALGRLQARGLLQPVQGGLAIVELSRSNVIELYAMRAILEGAAARFAAENATASDLELIRLAASRFTDADKDAEVLAISNIRFHVAIYDAAHNTYLARMLEDMNDSLALLPKTTFVLSGRSKVAVNEHLDILNAIISRNPDGAESAARHHIEEALKARLTLML